MRLTSTHCDKRDHGLCDGTCVYMDQDGPNHYVCECGCHAAGREARRKDDALARVKRLLVTERIDHLYEVVAKTTAPSEPEAPVNHAANCDWHHDGPCYCLPAPSEGGK